MLTLDLQQRALFSVSWKTSDLRGSVEREREREREEEFGVFFQKTPARRSEPAGKKRCFCLIPQLFLFVLSIFFHCMKWKDSSLPPLSFYSSSLGEEKRKSDNSGAAARIPATLSACLSSHSFLSSIIPSRICLAACLRVFYVANVSARAARVCMRV